MLPERDKAARKRYVNIVITDRMPAPQDESMPR
jgi:hypothetical protein